MKYIIWVVLVALILAFAYMMTDEFNRAGLLSSEGYVGNGTKFGVEIGKSRNLAAQRLLDRGLEPVALTSVQSCHGRTYDTKRQVELWYDRTWRRGTICLSSEANKVTSVSWIYNWAAP